jgi:hypothetical protein
MKWTTAWICLVLGGFAWPQTAMSQLAPHTLTYTPKNAAIGSVVKFGLQDYRIVRYPVRDVVSGQKYYVTAPAPDLGFGAIGSIEVSHGPLAEASNITIDGFPAHVGVIESRDLSIQPDQGSPGTYKFEARSEGFVFVQIDVGDVVINISTFLSGRDPSTNLVGPETEINIGAVPNALPLAEWWKYTDATWVVLQLDNWLDYVRVHTYP